jgi:acetyl esterase/lipase
MAKAVTWVHANIGKHGGNRDKLFVAGYSAGGHLAALIATDESYLRAEGLNRRSVSGVISISGVYSAEKLPGLDLVFPVKDRDNYFATKHVNATTPKFLLFHAEKEFFGLDTQAKQFHAKLLKAGCKATLQSVSDADHFEMATEKTNRQFGPQVVDFIHGRTNVAAAMK